MPNTLEELKKAVSELDFQSLTFTVALVCLTILGSFILYRVFIASLRNFEHYLVESKKRSHRPTQAQRVKMVIGLFRQTGTVLLVLVTGVIVLDEIGVDIRPILAGAGVVGLAVGFGAQSLVKDFFTGLCLILENQVTIGDWVAINGKSGSVEILNFRITVLRDAEGAIHVFPNSSINAISNHTHGWSAAVLDLPVPPEQDYEKAAVVFRDLGEEMRQDEAWKDVITDDLEVLGVQDLSDRGMVMRVKIKTVPGSHWSLSREFRRRLKARWDELGFAIPKTTQHMVMLGGPPPQEPVST